MYIRPNVFTQRCLHIFRLYDLISTFSVNYQRDVEYCIILYRVLMSYYLKFK